MRHVVGLLLSSAVAVFAVAQPPAAFDRYHTPAEVIAHLQALQKAHGSQTALHTLGVSRGGTTLPMLEIGPDVGKAHHSAPALMVVANLAGVLPLSTEGALHLIERLLKEPSHAQNRTWYIVPNANPDAAWKYFRKPLWADERNAGAWNDDMDDRADEDGPEDLDGNGVISQMRVPDPQGEWMVSAVDPRLMRLADPAKGEKGRYKLYTEGLDNDGDGQFNEDPQGGVDISLTFPHLWRPFTTTSGRWPGAEPETFGLMQFAAEHPEIAMTVVLGATNLCLQPPAGGRPGTYDPNAIRIPEPTASRFGLDATRTYTMKEILEQVGPTLPPGMELSESMVGSFLGLGATVNPLEQDLKVYSALSDQYKAFLKAAKLEGKRLDPPQPKDGSFELWAYYHLGLPSFSMDFWTLPETKDATPEKPGPVVESAPAVNPPSKSQASGDPDSKAKAFLAFNDAVLGSKGFVPWKAFKHPQLGEVELGGVVPYANTTPPPGMILPLLEAQVPWLFTLADKLPRLRILKSLVTPKGAGVFGIEVWVENQGYLPWPTAMGKRSKHVGAAVLSMMGKGTQLLSGRARTAIQEVEGGRAAKVQWLVRGAEGTRIDLKLESPNAGMDTASLVLQDTKGGAQ